MITNVEKALNKFFDKVISFAKKNLKRLDKNATEKLSRSLDHKVKVSKSGNSFEADILMAAHGKYVDAGVKGVGGKKADGTNWKLKRVTNNKYRYNKLKPPASAFDKWSIARGVAARDKKGRFLKRRASNFAIAKSVYHTGLETTNFISEPFDKYFKTLPDDIIEAFGLDVEDMIEFSLKTHNKDYK